MQTLTSAELKIVLVHMRLTAAQLAERANVPLSAVKKMLLGDRSYLMQRSIVVAYLDQAGVFIVRDKHGSIVSFPVDSVGRPNRIQVAVTSGEQHGRRE